MADLWPAQLIYRDMPGLTPFRELEMAWGQSSAAVVLSCVDVRTPGDATQDVRIASVSADPCTPLFGPDIEPRLPIVSFSDFNCPNCCVLDAILADHDATNPGTIRIFRHELPLLGGSVNHSQQSGAGRTPPGWPTPDAKPADGHANGV